ncbi:MAG: YdcF family protein [Chloroflexi bacterium]|nr:YdcF family protein [Chloroflexota bacterium]
MTAPRLAALVVALLAVVGVLGAARLLPAVGTFLVVSEPLEPADAIIVLAGNAPARLPHAEDLFHQGLAPLLIVSDEEVHTQTLDTTWSRLYALGVVASDLPASALTILTDPPPESTLDEAERDAAMLQARGLHSAILVTDPFHSRRARLLFGAEFARHGLTVRSSPNADQLDLPHWWMDRAARRMVVEEYVKLGAYLVTGRYIW